MDPSDYCGFWGVWWCFSFFVVVLVIFFPKMHIFQKLCTVEIVTTVDFNNLKHL